MYIIFLEICKRTVVASGEGNVAWIWREIYSYIAYFLVLVDIFCYHVHALLSALKNCFLKGKHEI